jgi:uncharacterized protein YbjT (DUF2867 family)
MTQERKRILVCGATGYLGRHVVKCAHEHGHWVRALVRNEQGLGETGDYCDDVFVGQATDAQTLTGLCDGVDVVFSALGNRTMKRKPTCFEVDYAANMNLVNSAKAAGVAHFIFVSVLRGGEMRKKVPQIEAREQVVDALVDGELPYTIIRPTGFYNDMSEFLEMARKGTVWIPKTSMAFNPIHGADLAEVCIAPVGDPSSYGRQIPAGGPDILTMREIAALCFQALDKPPKIRAFPIWLLKGIGTMMKPFNVNVASLLLMFSAMMGFEGDATCDAYGTHHLADFYAELAQSDEDSMAVRSGQ